MAVTFDGPNKRIICTTGTTQINVTDIYSRWKDWVASGNAQYLEAFQAIGGNDIDPTAGTAIPTYAFLINGWRIRPQESAHTLNVSGGILLVQGGGDPFVDTLGTFRVNIRYSQPSQAIAIATNGSGGADPVAIATAVLDESLAGHLNAGSVGYTLDKARKAAELAAALSA